MPVMAMRARDVGGMGDVYNTRRMTGRTPSLAVRLYALGAAAVFAASLGSGVWLYVSLGRPVVEGADGRQGAVVAVLIDVLLFGLFALHHSLLARTGAKAWLVRVIRPSLERSTYVWIASLLFLLVVFAWQPVPGVLWQVEGAPRWLLIGVQAAGIALTLLAATVLDPRELSGLTQAWRGTPDAPRDPSDRASDAGGARPAPVPDPFTTRGAYGLVRHPIYLGWFLMVWPTPLMTGGRLTFAAISSAYLLLAIPWEERSLLDQYGDAYRRYTHKVRWKVFPGVH